MSQTIRPVETSSLGGEPLRVGIDLGTSSSAICASNERRAVVESYVGWPVDAVARRLLGKELAVGAEAIEMRTLLELHRPLQRGLIKQGAPRDVEAVREIVKALLASVGAERGRVRAVLGVPSEALRVNRHDLRRALAGLVDHALIVSEPFAVAYGVEALLHALVVDIGAGTTDFCLMRGRYPVEGDQKTLTVAGDSIDQHLLRLVRARYPQAAVTIHMIRCWKETHAHVGGEPREVMVEAPVDGRPTRLDIGHEMRLACESILPPLMETLLELLGRVEADFQERVRQSIVLAGGSSRIDGLRAEIERRLEVVGGGAVRGVREPALAGAEGGLAIAVDTADEDWERLPMAASA